MDNSILFQQRIRVEKCVVQFYQTINSYIVAIYSVGVCARNISNNNNNNNKKNRFGRGGRNVLPSSYVHAVFPLSGLGVVHYIIITPTQVIWAARRVLRTTTNVKNLFRPSYILFLLSVPEGSADALAHNNELVVSSKTLYTVCLESLSTVR